MFSSSPWRSTVALFSGAAVLAVSTVACSGSRQPGLDPGTLRGEVMFRGIFLGTGAVADHVPEIRDRLKLEYFVPDGSARDRVVRGFDRILGQLKVDEPAYFDRFARVMRSRDRVAIRAQVLRSTQDIVGAISKIPEYRQAFEVLQREPEPLRQAMAAYNETAPPELRVDSQKIDRLVGQLSSGGDPQLAFTCGAVVFCVAWVVAWVDVVAVSNVAIAVAVWRFIGVYTEVVGPSAAIGRLGDLTFDSLVDSLAVHLG